jgi:hypothetical protein
MGEDRAGGWGMGYCKDIELTKELRPQTIKDSSLRVEVK